MAVSTLATLSDAVVDALNAAPLSQPFSAVRAYVPQFDLAQMQDLHVTVVPKRVTSQAADRSRSQFEYEIDVAVQKKLDTVDNGAIDDLASLTQEIADLFRTQRLEDYPSAMCLKSQIDPVYALEHLDQLRQFTSVITLTFREWR
jgi:hypothetical protein